MPALLLSGALALRTACDDEAGADTSGSAAAAKGALFPDMDGLEPGQARLAVSGAVIGGDELAPERNGDYAEGAEALFRPATSSGRSGRRGEQC